MLLPQSRCAFDGLSLIEIGQDLLNFVFTVTELAKRHAHRLIRNFEKPTTYEFLVLDESNIGLHPRGVAIHHKGDGPGRSQHRDLGVLEPVFAAFFHCRIPNFTRSTEQLRADTVVIHLVRSVPVHTDHFQEWLPIHSEFLKRTHGMCNFRAHQVGLAAHQRCDRSRKIPALVAVVGLPLGHQKSPEIRVTETQWPEKVTVFLNRLGGVAREIDQYLLGKNRQRHRRTKVVHLERLILGIDEGHQVQARQIAGRIVQEHIFGTGVTRIDATRGLHRIPAIDRAVVLNSRIATEMGGLGHFIQKFLGLECLKSGSLGHRPSIPGPILLGGTHELILDTHRVIGVLEIDGVISSAGHIETAVIACINQRPGLLLLVRLAADELPNVRVFGIQDHHFGGAAGLTTRLNHPGKSIEAPHERNGTRGHSAPRQLFA